MATRVYNGSEVKADLYARIPGDGEMEILLGDAAIGDSPFSFWQYDASSSATDDFANGVIKPTAQSGNGRWLRRGYYNVVADWNQATSTVQSYIQNKPSLATVATSGAYTDLTSKPSLATVATTGVYADLTGKPSLATVATSGSYNDLSNKPSIPSTTRTTSTQSISLVGTGATGTQVSSTNDSTVRFTVSTSTTSTIGGPATSVVTLKKCATNSATEGDWTAAALLESDQTITLAIALQSIQVVKGQLCTDLPAGWFVKLVNSGSGTHAEAFVSGEKTIYG